MPHKDRITHMYNNPIIFRESIEVDAPKHAILYVIKDPLRLPEWSLFFERVEKKDQNYLAHTPGGSIEFDWDYDEGSAQATMSYELGNIFIKSYFFVEEHDGKTYFGEEFPIDSTSPETLVESIRSTGLAEIAKLKRLVEGSS